MSQESAKKALSMAIKDKDVENVRLLLNKVDINSYIEDSGAPIHLIADYDLNNESAREIFNLITTHPKVNINLELGYGRENSNFVALADLGGETILHLAKRASLVKMLLKIDKINVDAAGSVECMTPLLKNLSKLGLQDRIEEDFEVLEIAKLLIENGADINLSDCYVTAPIHTLAELNFNYTQMKDFYNFFVNQPELNINVRDRESNSLLDHTTNAEMMRVFVDLPWKPTFLLSALEIGDEITNEKVFQKWDQHEQYTALMEELLDEIYYTIRCRSLLKAMWTYIYRHKNETSQRLFQHFFGLTRFDEVYHSLMVNEYENFIECYLKYRKGITIIKNKCVRGSFLKFKDCDVLRTLIKHMDREELLKLNLNDDLFLYLITHFQCDLNEVLKSFRPTINHNQDCLKKYFFNLQHTSRYCTLPVHLFEHYRENACKYNAFRDGIKQIEEVVYKPKSLLELSRNTTRKFLAFKYEVDVAPQGMEPFLDRMNLPRDIKKILMLETVIHSHISLPETKWDYWAEADRLF